LTPLRNAHRGQIPSVLARLSLVLEDFRPNLLANYLYDLAIAFHAFYETCPVLKAGDPEVRDSRLVSMSQDVSRHGLG
jgi:arginyl-tRNA synthetase